jgi:hypothetical protein
MKLPIDCLTENSIKKVKIASKKLTLILLH